MKNWAGNLEYATQRVHYAKSVDEVRELVLACRKVRTLGTKHSFNTIADSPDDLISLRDMDRLVQINHDAMRPTVTVEGGIAYGQFCRELNREGYALHNLASLPHISVAGACATATHGSGDRNGNLATAVSAMQIVKADGEVVDVSRGRDGERFDGMVVALGAIGVITKLTLDVQPAFAMRQEVFENLPFAAVQEHFDTIMSSGYSVSFFLDWRAERIKQVWIKRRESEAASSSFNPELHGATRATSDLHPLAGCPAENCTQQMGVAGPWHERLPHFRMEFTPSVGEELQTEYFVPRHHAVRALEAVFELREQICPLLNTSEIRTIAADTLWMSPSYQQPVVGIHFTWHNNWPAVRELLPKIEARLATFGARPHWGKLFTMPPEQLQPLYPRLADFRNLLAEWDPNGKFRNAFVERFVF